ncbi:MAG: TolB family protein [Gemmatimonadaceae bacterium]
MARRGAGSAERAYAKLAPLLKPARGRIDMVVTDHADFTNGYAWVSPSPRIVIFARPPVDERTLRFREDWFDLVVQHELVHVFQIDRTRGWWRVAQAVFGRQPLLFPNAWAPSWLIEGLAVHYESKLGDGGRAEGMALVPVLNGSAADNALRRLGSWSSSSLDYPGGGGSYVYGTMLVEAMSAHGGDGAVERFVERASGRLNPFSFERTARREFGTSFAAQWRTFADSVTRAVHGGAGGPGIAPLTVASWVARYPRRAADGSVLFVAANGRDATGLYEISARDADASSASPERLATPRRIARRNTLDANVRLADGRVLFAQGEWEDPWRLRSDLWVREVNGREHRLTHGERLIAPDVRARDGAIVATQVVAGSTRLVRVGWDGAVTPLTTAALDTNWSAPRWSHDGTRIAATRWVRGGTMSIVVLDSAGRNPRTLASARATVDDPSWTLNDSAVLFMANTSGTGEIWSADVATGALRVVGSATTSFDSPLAVRGGVVAVETRAAGERLTRIASRAADLAPPSAAGVANALPSIADQSRAEPPAVADGPVRPYRPLRQLIPRFWMPLVESSDENRSRFGAWIGSSDITGRHAYALSMAHEPDRREMTGSFSYRYAGFGLPLLDVAARQNWDHTDLVDTNNALAGVLARRRRFVGTSLTYLRQRVRTATVLSAGAEMEFRDFVTDPAPLIERMGSPLFLKTLKYPTFTAMAAWANTRSPILALGPEDGVAISATGRWRWRTDDASATRSAAYVGTAAAYKSLGFIPGRSHHVVAIHAAAGTTDDKTNTELEAGGESGSSAEIASGVVIGDTRRNFAVRGFEPGAQVGIRALGASAEWRAPLALMNWGRGFVPFFAQRVSATLFGDAGTAWCPAGSTTGIGCPRGVTPRAWMASVGGELILDAAVLNYDVPYRLRFGYARPMRGKAYADAPNGSAYFSLGLSF